MRFVYSPRLRFACRPSSLREKRVKSNQLSQVKCFYILIKIARGSKSSVFVGRPFPGKICPVPAGKRDHYL